MATDGGKSTSFNSVQTKAPGGGLSVPREMLAGKKKEIANPGHKRVEARKKRGRSTHLRGT